MVDLSKYNQQWFDRGRSSITVLIWYIVQHTLFKFSLHNMYGYRAFWLRLFGCKAGKNVKVRRTCEITYPWKVEIGDNSWVDDEVLIYSLDKIVIGSNCSITRRSFLCTGNHDIEDPYFGLVVKPITVKDGAWIQADCFVGQGVVIGQNCVVGARSSVFNDLPDNMICYGTPCKPVKGRVLRSD
ncbi:MAG: WcaF family extracellular polysaccharide biosynthesis acetyltransferase [Clostridia bacterium]|nr:WcaF family extracellular polysaccharide biosynthesis acetyltransferase [Clostridia bacterium]